MKIIVETLQMLSLVPEGFSLSLLGKEILPSPSAKSLGVYKYYSRINYLWKCVVTTIFFFWISITLVKIYISCVIINRGKVGSVLNLL